LERQSAVVFVFVAIPERTLEKYGERGGRFILMKVSHYTQNLALRLACEKLGGVFSGGFYNEGIKQLLNLQTINVLITVGFACGSLKP